MQESLTVLVIALVFPIVDEIDNRPPLSGVASRGKQDFIIYTDLYLKLRPRCAS